MKHLFTSLALAVLVLSGASVSATEITRLRTEYQTNPVGLEVAVPRLSWQMVSDTYGAAQTAYRVVSALSEEALAAGDYIYDSGKVLSDKSVSIPYGGKVSPCTKYFWKVYVWNEKDRMTESAAAQFETGLMNTGWSGARWIGSDVIAVSPYRTDYVIEYDARVLPGSTQAVFAYGAKDSDNYYNMILDTEAMTCTLIQKWSGETSEIFKADLSDILAPGSANAYHHFKIDSYSTRGERIDLKVEVDGVNVYTGIVRYPGNWHNSPKLHNYGYMQPEGQKAEFTNISIGEKLWQSVFFTDHEVHEAAGTQLWEPHTGSAPMLRKEFSISGEVESARLYATARGIYEFEINGELVGTDYYNPGWPDFHERIYYNTFDVTDMLLNGENAVGAVLGAGWWNDAVGLTFDPYGTAQSLLGKLVIEYKDGRRQVIVTDGSWKVYDDGPVVLNGMITGEDYDARKEVADWSKAGFDDSKWEEVRIFDAPKAIIQAYIGETIKNHETLTALSVTEPVEGVFVYDMGVNMVGIPRLTNIKGEAGRKITLCYAEMLWPEVMPESPIPPYTLEQYEQMKGQLYVDNYRAARSEDTYILKGDAEGETFEPRLTQHGYRYISITGLDEPLALEDVKGLVLHSIGEQLSFYETSDKNVNQLFENILWGERGNFLSVPTDCPQRDERMGWTGDAQVFGRTATYNMMTDGFYTRWMNAVRDAQGANGSYTMIAPSFEKGGDNMGWMEAGIINPWQVYQQYGDIRILEEHYDSMTRYMDYLGRRAKDFIQPGGLYGDWLGLAITNTSLTNSAYYGYDALLMSKIAKVLGKDADAEKYSKLFEDIKEAWNREFVDAEGYTQAISCGIEGMLAGVSGVPAPVITDATKPMRVHTQTSYVVPLYAGLFNEENKPKAVAHLVELLKENNYILNTGFIGTPYLCLVLSENGHNDVAYKLFEQTEYPSWLFPVLQGATTMWERWNSYTIKNGFGIVAMNSFNHYAYGAIEDWMMSQSVGIERDEANPGYKHIILQPQVGGTMEFVRGGFESIYGKISSGWEKTADGFIYTATVPANTTATLTLPGAVKVLKGGKGIAKRSGNVFELTGGTYSFKVVK